MLGRSKTTDSAAFQAGIKHVRREIDLEKRLRSHRRIGPIRSFELGARSALSKSWSTFPRIQVSAAVAGALEALPRVQLSLAGTPKLRRILLAGTIIAGALPAAAFFAPMQTDKVIGAFFRALPTADEALDVARHADCAEFLAVSAQGEMVGFLPAKSGCSDRHFRSVQPSATAAHEQALADAAIEGDISGPGTVLSISLPGLARAAYYKVSGRVRIGGTNPLQTAIEATAGRSGGLGLFEKLRFTFWTAPSFTANRLATVEDREVWTIAMLTCAKGMPYTGGGFTPVAGDLCGYLVGAESLEDLEPAQRCIIAALRKRPLALPGPNAGLGAMREYQAAWANANRRADDKCLALIIHQAFPVSSAREGLAVLTAET